MEKLKLRVSGLNYLKVILLAGKFREFFLPFKVLHVIKLDITAVSAVRRNDVVTTYVTKLYQSNRTVTKQVIFRQHRIPTFWTF
jgi:hypothetical protein